MTLYIYFNPSGIIVLYLMNNFHQAAAIYLLVKSIKYPNRIT